MKKPMRITIVLAALLAATAALACGDKLAAIGGGVRFERVYAARHPGRIALFIPQQSGLRSANEELHLADALRRAGHQVIVIDDTRDLPDRLQPDRIDLLLVDVADTHALAASVNNAPRALLLRAGGKAADANRDGDQPAQCVTQLSRRTSLQLLRRIDDALDRSERGLPPACPADLATRGA
jgi:hypothetical protein